MITSVWVRSFGLSMLVASAGGPAAAVSEPTVSEGGPAGVSLSLTGTLDGTTYQCGSGTNFSLPAGTEVYFCYSVENTGGVTLSRHDLVDTQFGSIFSGLTYSFTPGASVFVLQNGPLALTTNETATWTAYNPGPVDVASDTDAILITVAPPLIGCNLPTSTFSGGLPVGWTSHDALAWPDANADSRPDWRSLAGCLEAANYTGARGDVACASSDLDPAHGAFDTELRSHRFSLVGQSSARLEFTLNYQNFAGQDTLDVDVTTNDGGSWSNLLSLTSDQGLFRAVGGVTYSVDLASVLGQASVKLRWRYRDLTFGASDWYVQVDNIRLLCGNAIFLDGFTSGDADAWSGAVGAP